MQFKGKVAIITGGSLGIGLAMSKAFAAEGANLVVVSNDKTQFENVKEITGVRIETFQADVSKPEEVDNMVKFTLEKFGTVDILVNCAGIYGPIGLMTDNDVRHWLATININLCGTFLCMRAVLPVMMKKNRGKIVNMSGGGGASPLPRFSAYGTSKAGVIRLTETIANEVKDYKIDINAIAPGPVNTRLLDEALTAGDAVGADFKAKILKQKEEGGVPPENVAELAVYLASSEADGLSGKLVSLLWDNWRDSKKHLEDIKKSDVYTMRRIIPKDRGFKW
ncbi:MAG: SDR family NAD(P)-dependent oxidoreductase [Dehalococcoidales bacterium]|nr:SDR family NAD(P)-dependent oxidoreductase [Dehalococcoidales bacterium]